MGKYDNVRGGEEVVTTKRYEIDHVEKISIAAESVDVYIQPHDEKVIDLVFTSVQNGPTLEVEETEDSMSLKVIDPTAFRLFHLFPKRAPKAMLVVKAPADIADAWDIDAVSRSVFIGKIQADAVRAHMRSGTITCPELTTDMLDIQSTSGVIELGNIQAKNTRLSLTSGRMNIQDLVSTSTTCNFSSGKVDIERLIGNHFDGKCTSGNIRITNSIIDQFQQTCVSGAVYMDHMQTEHMETRITSGRLTIDHLQAARTDVRTTSGKIDIGLDKRQSDWHLQLHASYGKVEAPAYMEKTYDGNKKMEGTIGNGGNVLEAKATAGKIRIW